MYQRAPLETVGLTQEKLRSPRAKDGPTDTKGALNANPEKDGLAFGIIFAVAVLGCVPGCGIHETYKKPVC